MFSACQNQVVWVTNNQCKPVSHRVLGLGVKKINKEDSCICRGFVLNKPWVFLLTTLFPFKDFYGQFNFLLHMLQHSSFFLSFTLKFCMGNWHTTGQKWSPHTNAMFDHCVTSITVKGLHHSPCNLPILRSPDHAAILVSCQFIDYPSVFVVVVAFFCLAKLIFCCLFPVAVNLHLLDAKNYSIWL